MYRTIENELAVLALISISIINTFGKQSVEHVEMIQIMKSYKHSQFPIMVGLLGEFAV